MQMWVSGLKIDIKACNLNAIQSNYAISSKNTNQQVKPVESFQGSFDKNVYPCILNARVSKYLLKILVTKFFNLGAIVPWSKSTILNYKVVGYL